MSFVFGLLHGLGFASALSEIGLPRADLAAGLLFFNLGVELGQLAFVAVLIAIVILIRRAVSSTVLSAPAVRAAAYVLGIPAAFWFIERTTGAFV